MGRIKTKEIKRMANHILSLHGDKFSASFETNKEVFKQLDGVDVESKWLSNRIIGYITTLKKRRGDELQ